MALTIEAVDVRCLDIPLAAPLATSRHTYTSLPFTFVRVRLSDGTEGFGEAREVVQITGETQGSIRIAIEKRLGKAVLGLTAGDFEALHAAMNSVLAKSTAAKSAVDMAAYDAFGRASGLPVSQLLGGGDRGPIASSKAISVGSTEAMVAEARQSAEAGFATLKIKTGLDAAAETQAIRDIRREVGPAVHLKLDANQAWSLQEASRFLDEVEDQDIQMVEQPLPAWDLKGSAALRRRTSIPVILDEAVHGPEDARQALEAGACDYVNIKLVKSGGLYPALKIAAIAESAGAACQIGTLDTALGSAAAVHLVDARRRTIRFAEINGPSRLEKDVGTGFRLADGHADVEPGPGLGIAVDAARLGFDCNA